MKESNEMISTITETRPKESSSTGGKTREEIVQENSREMLKKLPPNYNIQIEVKELIKKLPGPKLLNDKGLTVPLNVFLYQEIARMQKVIALVRSTLQQIIEAIDGTIIMTP
mmetsp:Transcript_99776/g.149450  ORF Transcript_99776/g.149450 Transcript_99776/m.149450 type:complete len:112 (+) Transcript_99776:3549-3884(+)